MSEDTACSHRNRMDSKPARVGLLWASATSLGLCYIYLKGGSESRTQGFKPVCRYRCSLKTTNLSCVQHLPSFPSSALSNYTLFAASLIAAVGFAIATHSIYMRAERSASAAILICLALLGCQIIWEPSIMADAERLLVFLPLSMCAGLSWATYGGIERPTGMIYPSEKL